MAKYMLLQHYSGADCGPMSEWAPDEITAHIDFQRDLTKELTESGELVGGEGLAGPELAKIVTSDGGAPVVSDGPFPESKEFLAGYRIVDVDSEQRALEIAARISAAPGPNGDPIKQQIEVREVMSA